MSKKVLIVEPSLAVRGIAESLLRQNGYEVIAAEKVEAAREILRGSKIDLLLVASDINDDSGQPFFESLGADKSTAMLPLLVLHDSAAGEDIAYPPEAIINKPFTPRDFLDSVAAFGGEQTPVAESSPFDGADFEDALIDSALGLDKIDVDDAEVLEDDTSVYRKNDKGDKVESMIGFDVKVPPEDTTNTPKKKIAAINLPPETVSPKEKQPAPPKPEPEVKEEEFLGHADGLSSKPGLGQLSESSKIEIVTDQYGISTPGDLISAGDTSGGDDNHDYDWFMSELQKEGKEESSPPPTSNKKESAALPPPTSNKKESAASPPPAPQKVVPESPVDQPKEKAQSPTHTEAVDKFISEFKKEMEKITGDAASNIEVTNVAASPESEVPSENIPSSGKSKLEWEEGLEKITAAEINDFAGKLVESLADRIAHRLVENLDQDIIYHLIKDSIETVLNRRIREESRKP